MIPGIFSSKDIGAARAVPDLGVPNMARWSVVTASGARVARLDEVPKVRGIKANLGLSMPAIRARWVPRYAIDGSPLTFWGSEESEELRWIQFDLGTKLRKAVKVSAVAISWGDDYAKRYCIMASNDGTYWRQVHQQESGKGGVETVKFDHPLQVAALRLEVMESKGTSAAVVDVGIYGESDGPEPGVVKGFKVGSMGTDNIKLQWDRADDSATYFYRVYRSRSQAPSPTPENLVETTSKHEIIDYGLVPDTKYFYRLEAVSFGGKVKSYNGYISAKTGKGVQFSRFEFRGVIEGFYNDPWPHQERLKMISFLEDAGFNYYIYAPKVEPFHRQLWREAYPAAELKNFAELVVACRAHGITFNYGISPGLDMDFKDAAEVVRLKEKLKSLFDTGIRAFTLCFDDIPSASRADRAVGEVQVKIVNDVFDYLRSLDPGVQLFFVPTVYSRTPSYYKKKNSKKLGYLEAMAGIKREVGIMWTGPAEVFSPRIDKESAMEFKLLWERPVLIWDNYPVNDVALRNNIFMGPYLGRSHDLGDAVGGIFLNPMYLPNASKVPLYTAGKYMTRPEYDPWQAYDEGLRFLGGSDKGYRALKTISDCLLAHPVFPDLSIERMPVHGLIGDFWSSRAAGGNDGSSENALREMLSSYARNPDDLKRHLDDIELAHDLMPASEKLAAFGEAGVKSLDLMKERDPDQRINLRSEILELQMGARLNPWHVADERTSLAYVLVGARIGSRSVLDDFITRTLRELP